MPGELPLALLLGVTTPALRVTPLDAAGREIEAPNLATSSKAMVARDVDVETDLLWVKVDGRAQEWRLLRSRNAPPLLTDRVELDSPGATLSLADGRLVARDRDGSIIASTAPVRAIDARGDELPLLATLESEGPGRWRFEARLPPTALASARFPIAIDPAWTAGWSMAAGRANFCAFVLADGRVLAFAGDDGTSRYASAGTIWNPTAMLGTNGGPSGIGMGCTQLADGRVVTLGGFVGALNPNGQSNVFDLSAGWQSKASAIGILTDAALAQVDADRVLAVGAFNRTTATAEMYSFAANAWTAVTGPNTARDGALMQRLGDGTILVVGGGAATAERYYPSTAKFSYTAGAPAGTRSLNSQLTLLTSGKVLLTGEYGNELYDPATDKFTAAAPNLVGRSGHGATRLLDGRVLVAGGASDTSSELYDPTTGLWSFAGNTLLLRTGASLVALPDGRATLIGGRVGGAVDNSTETWGNPDGVTCKADYECVSGHCTDGVCCQVASCGAGFSCGIEPALGRCSKSLGATCGADADCASGHCADGVCCSTTCTGLCASCAIPGKAGSCAAVLGAPLASHGSCSGTGVGTVCGPSCNGVDTTSCSLPSGTSCATASCASGIATSAGTCDGGGHCSTTSASCGSFACSSTSASCATSCTTKADCAAGFVCDAGTCVPPADLGIACARASECSTGFCTDGVCCGVASCGGGASCALGKPVGTCGKKLASSCSVDDECGAGSDGARHCVDGVCCEKACDGQCEACDVEGYVGTCTAVNGAPHGKRTGCDDGGANKCAARTCVGATDPTRCVGYANGAGTSCGGAHCDASGGAVSGSSCDGMGNCVAAASTSCVPYACGSDGACVVSCASAADCASGSACRAGRCEASSAQCSPDGLGSIAADGTTTDCAPYRCVDSTGGCSTSCMTSADCSLGATCTSGVCAAPTVSNASGGCSFGTRGGTNAVAVLALMLVVAAMRRKELGQ